MCLKEAAKNKKPAEQVQGGEKYSKILSEVSKNPKDLTKSDAISLLEGCRNGYFRLDSYIPVIRTTPDIIIEKARGYLELQKLPMFMAVKKAQQMLEDEQENNDRASRAHGIDEETASSIFEGMFSPDYIVYQKKNSRIAALIKHKGKTALVSIDSSRNINKDLTNGYEGSAYNIVVTLFNLDSLTSYLEDENNLILYKKSKANHEEAAGSFVPSLSNDSPYKDNIPHINGNVNNNSMQDSSKDTDKASKYIAKSNQTDTARANQRKTKKSSAKRKKTHYNEFATLLMIWANSESTPVGETLCLNKHGKKHYYKKTESGFISITRDEANIRSGKFDEWYVAEGQRISDNIASNASPLGGSESYVSLDGDRGNAGRSDNGTSGTDKEGTQSGYTSDTKGSGGYNREILSSVQSGSDNSESGLEFSRRLNDKDDNSNDNIKYSKQITQQTEDNIEQLALENEALRELLDSAKDVEEELRNRLDVAKKMTRTTRGLIPDKTELFRIVRKYNHSKSGYTNTELVKYIDGIMWDLRDKQGDSNTLMNSLTALMQDLLETSETVNRDLYEQYADFRKYFRGSTLYVNQNVYDFLLEEYGSKKNLRNATLGKLNIKPMTETDSGTTLTQAYQDIVQHFPELLNPEVDEYHKKSFRRYRIYPRKL